MGVITHPMWEAHRLACVDLLARLNSDWYAEAQFDPLAGAVNPWNSNRVDKALQALYRPRFAAHYQALTGRKHTQDCPEDYLRGFRAIAMAHMLHFDLFERYNALSQMKAAKKERPPSANRAHTAPKRKLRMTPKRSARRSSPR